MCILREVLHHGDIGEVRRANKTLEKVVCGLEITSKMH
jgi:hypothetical protein